MKTKTQLLTNLLIIFTISGLFLTNFSYAQAGYSAGTIISLTNSARSSNGLGSLTVNSSLSSAAYAKANDILQDDYFAHTSPDGTTPWDFIRESGYSYAYAGENLAIGYTDANELFDAWMASSTHRDNILNSNFREIGVAVASGDYEGSETIVVVQEFGAAEEETNQNVASFSSTPAPEATTETPPDNASNTNNANTEQTTPSPNTANSESSSPTFNIVKEKSKINPEIIFSGEETEITVVINGEVQTLEVQVGEDKINFLETSSSSQSDQGKVYQSKKKFDKEGKFEVTVLASDKSGERKTLSLGQLTVKKTVISNNPQLSTSQGLFAGFKQSVKDQWYIYVIGGGGIIITLVGYIAFRKIKDGKAMIAFWKI